LKIKIKFRRLSLKSNKRLLNIWIKLCNRFRWKVGCFRRLEGRRNMRAVCRVRLVGFISSLQIILFCQISLRCWIWMLRVKDRLRMMQAVRGCKEIWILGHKIRDSFLFRIILHLIILKRKDSFRKNRSMLRKWMMYLSNLVN